MSTAVAEWWRSGCECNRAGLCYRCQAAAFIEDLSASIEDLRITNDALQLNLEMADDELRRTCETLKELRLALTNIHALSSVPLVESSRHALEGIISRIDDYAFFALNKAKAAVTMQELDIRGECAP